MANVMRLRGLGLIQWSHLSPLTIASFILDLYFIQTLEISIPIIPCYFPIDFRILKEHWCCLSYWECLLLRMSQTPQESGQLTALQGLDVHSPCITLFARCSILFVFAFFEMGFDTQPQTPGNSSAPAFCMLGLQVCTTTMLRLKKKT